MKIKAVFFDMDGVLVDAKEWHYSALNLALERKGYPPILISDHLQTYDGLPTRQKLYMYPPTKTCTHEEIEELNALKQHLTCEVIATSCKPEKHLLDLMKELTNQGFRIACCSNSVRNSVASMLDQSGLLEYIDFYISNEDVEKGKPAPEMYLKAMSKMNLRPEEVLICEDNIRGIKAALASNAYVLQIGTVEDTNIENIFNAINTINRGESNHQLLRPECYTARIDEMPDGAFIAEDYPAMVQRDDLYVNLKEIQAGNTEHLYSANSEMICCLVKGKVKYEKHHLREKEVLYFSAGKQIDLVALDDSCVIILKMLNKYEDDTSMVA